MPAPRSILIDIHERGLDHEVAHKSVDSSGRLKLSVNKTDDVVMPTGLNPEPEIEIVIEQKVPNALRKLSTESTFEDEKANEGAGSVEHKQAEAVTTTKSPAKNRKRRSAT